MDNRRKRQLRRIGYSFMAAGLAASMTVSSGVSVLAVPSGEDILTIPETAAGIEELVQTASEEIASATVRAAEPAESSSTTSTEAKAAEVSAAESSSGPLMISSMTVEAGTEVPEETTGGTTGYGLIKKADEEPASSGASQADVTETSGTEDVSESQEPGSSEPSSTEPGYSEPDVTEPWSTEPGTSEPWTSEPDSSEPASDEPVSEEPLSEEPVSEEPVSEEPVTDVPVTDDGTASGTDISDSLLDPLPGPAPILPDVVAVSPEDYAAVRAALVKQARSLVGKVTYFWGGKSTAIGWDSRWGIPQVVTISGSKSTGTTRYFGLDCSGYVAWVFANAYGTSSILSQLGFNTPEQWANSYAINWQEVQVGDLLFKTTPYSGTTNHIGIVVEIGEDGTIWVAHCSSSRNGVVVTAAQNSGFKYIRRANLLKGDVAAPAIVNMQDLKIPEGYEVSSALAALAQVDTAGVRDWYDVDSLAQDLGSIFPDPVLAAAVAEGIWNVYAQIPDDAANTIVETAADNYGVLKASEIAMQFAGSDAGIRELHLDNYGFADLLDMVRRAEITVKAVGPAADAVMTRSEIEQNASPVEEPASVIEQSAAADVAVMAEYVTAAAEGEASEAGGISAMAENVGTIASLMTDIAGMVAEDSSTVAAEMMAGSEDAVEASGGNPEQSEATAGGNGENPEQSEAAAGEAAAEASEQAPAYVPVENIEGIQYLRSAKLIDLTNNNIHDLLPLDYFRVNTDGAYIYNLSLYYQNEEGLWFEDEDGIYHEDANAKLYFGGGVPGTSEEYMTELYVAGNPIETVPGEFPGRLWLDFVEQAKAQEQSLSVAAERFAAEQNDAAAVGQAAEESSPVVSVVPDEIIKAAEAVYVSVEAIPAGDAAQQDSGENNVVKTEN